MLQTNWVDPEGDVYSEVFGECEQAVPHVSRENVPTTMQPYIRRTDDHDTIRGFLGDEPGSES